MPALRNTGKNLARLREISAIVARHGFGDIFDRARIFEALGFRPKTEADAAVRRLSRAERFRLMLTELGPTFVKLGQVLSTRPDILPPDFLEELSKLQDRVPPLPEEQVRAILLEALGKPAEDAFSELDPTPLASASIGQVHAARTLDGQEVVVKIQRPDIRERIRADLDLLYYLAQFLERVVDETGIYTPTGIVEEFESSLMAELDYLNEAENLRLFHRLNAERTSVVIPRVHDSLTSSRVLTMERLRGVKITELDPARHDREAVVRNLIDSVFYQVFVDGVFHADPHPGNLFVLDDNRIGIVDFGLVGKLTKSMQDTVIVLCLAIALKDADTVARLLYKVGVPEQRVSLLQFRTDIAEVLEEYLGVELQDIESANLLNDLVKLALKYHIKIPQEYALLTKAAVTIEGVVRQVYPELDFLAVALPYAQRLVFDQVAPKPDSSAAMRSLLQMRGVVSDLPMQLSQILMDLEGGKFVVQVRSNDLPQLVGGIRWLGLVVFSGLIASALIMGAFFVLATHSPVWEVGGVPVLAIVGLALAGALFGAAFMWTLVGGKLQKISLRRLLGSDS